MLAAALLLAALPVTLPATQPVPPSPPCPPAAAADTGLVIEVNAGMELLQVMGWLAQRYPTPPDSRYKTAAWAHFGRFRDDAALAPLRTGPLYSDFTELGLWLTRFPRPVVCLPDSSSYYPLMGRARVAALLQGAARFAATSQFDAFRRRHRADHAAWVARVRADMQQRGVLTTVERFYRGPVTTGRPGAAVHVYLEPLNGWGAHMIDLPTVTGRAPDGVVRFQFGPEMENSLPSSPSNFAMSETLTALVWHEAGHAFLRPLVAAHAASIDALGRLFDAENGALARQGVTTWRYAFEENVVRSVVAVLIGAARGPAAMDAETKRQASAGFVWVPLLADVIQREYLPNRSAFPTFDGFSGRLLQALAARRDAADTRVTTAQLPTRGDSAGTPRPAAPAPRVAPAPLGATPTQSP